MNDPGVGNQDASDGRPRGSFTPRLACQEPASICHSKRAAHVSQDGRVADTAADALPTFDAHGIARSPRDSRHTARGSQFPLRAGPTITSVSVTRGSGAVNARRPIHALRPRVPRGPWALTAPSLRVVLAFT